MPLEWEVWLVLLFVVFSSGAAAVTDSETLSKFEIMDGAPIRCARSGPSFAAAVPACHSSIPLLLTANNAAWLHPLHTRSILRDVYWVY